MVQAQGPEMVPVEFFLNLFWISGRFIEKLWVLVSWSDGTAVTLTRTPDNPSFSYSIKSPHPHINPKIHDTRCGWNWPLLCLMSKYTYSTVLYPTVRSQVMLS